MLSKTYASNKGKAVDVDSIAVIPNIVLLKAGERYSTLIVDSGIPELASVVKNNEQPYVSFVSSALDFVGDKATHLHLYGRKRADGLYLSSSLELNSGRLSPTEAATGIIFSLLGDKEISINSECLKNRKVTERNLRSKSEFKLDDIDFLELDDVKYTHGAACEDDNYNTIGLLLKEFEGYSMPFSNDVGYTAHYASANNGTKANFNPVPEFQSLTPIIERSIREKSVGIFSLKKHTIKPWTRGKPEYDGVSALYEILARNKASINGINMYANGIDETLMLPRINQTTIAIKVNDETRLFRGHSELGLALSIYGNVGLNMKTQDVKQDTNEMPYIN